MVRIHQRPPAFARLRRASARQAHAFGELRLGWAFGQAATAGHSFWPHHTSESTSRAMSRCARLHVMTCAAIVTTACTLDTRPPTELRSPGGEYTVIIRGLGARALTPAFNHAVTGHVVKTGSSELTPVSFSIGDSLDQPFETQYSSTEWPAPNILLFKGSRANQRQSDDLVIRNESDRIVPCIKIFTISNYDYVLALDMKPKSQSVIAWRPEQGGEKAYFMAANCDTPGRTPSVYTVFPRSPGVKYSYSVTLTDAAIKLDVTRAVAR
jgi:hypothetical protein